MAKEKIKIVIPTEWKDITIGKYQEYLRVLKSKKKDKQKEEEIIALFCGLSKEIVNKIKLKDKKELVNKINLFVNNERNTELEKRIKFNGKKYGFIPNLSKITTGEFVDIEEYGKDINKNLHKIMSVLYREVERESKNFYKIKPYDPSEVDIEEFKDFPMSTAISSIDFFFRLGTTLLRDLNNSLTENQRKQVREACQVNGAGTT